MFSVEKVHRVPARPLQPGAPPWPFLFKLLNYKDSDVILYNARIRPEALRIDNAKISLFPNFPADLQKQRAKFTDVKRRLRDLGIKYATFYPARLRVEALGSINFFDKPLAAVQWLEKKTLSMKTATEDLLHPEWYSSHAKFKIHAKTECSVFCNGSH